MNAAIRGLVFAGIFFAGCARLFGWEIHAPAILSQHFYDQTISSPHRVALYLPDHLIQFTSTERGGKLADPQTYFIGEAFAPILVEAFQAGFDEFILFETEPTPELLAQYQISYLVVVDVTGVENKVTLKGQRLGVRSEVWVLDQSASLLAHLEADGASDAQGVFAKKGGPEVNLNAALENNALATVRILQGLFVNELALETGT